MLAGKTHQNSQLVISHLTCLRRTKQSRSALVRRGYIFLLVVVGGGAILTGKGIRAEFSVQCDDDDDSDISPFGITLGVIIILATFASTVPQVFPCARLHFKHSVTVISNSSVLYLKMTMASGA